MQKQLLLGVEAIAQGAIDGGISGVFAYPGTPSTEITEYIQESKQAIARNVHRMWSANEKTAMETALGMSYAGKRALVCMKHVGMNVAADCFMNAAITGANGGMVIIAADDPSMHSSQNEQFFSAFCQFGDHLSRKRILAYFYYRVRTVSTEHFHQVVVTDTASDDTH